MRLAITLSLENASTIVDAVLEFSRQKDLNPITVVVLDSGGKLIAMKSEDGSSLMRFDIAYGKAWGALGMGASSRSTRDRLSGKSEFQNALASVSSGRFIPVPGGVLIEDNEGTTVGAVGVSGDSADNDELCAIKAVQLTGLRSEPPEVFSNA